MVEVVLPAARRAVANTRSGRIGVIGTSATIRSRAYDDAFAASPNVTLTTVACPRLVEFVERGITSGRQILGLAQSYLDPLQQADVDTVVLGCTHYPLLTGVLQLAMGDQVTLVSSAEETAKDVVRVLTEHDLLADPDGDLASGHEFRCTGSPDRFGKLARRFVGPITTGAEAAFGVTSSPR